MTTTLHLAARTVSALFIAALALIVAPATADASPRSVLAAEITNGTDVPSSADVWYQTRGLDTGSGARLSRSTGTSAWEHPFPPSWPDVFTTGASCEVACIKRGTAHGESTIYLNVWTTTPVLWVLRVTNEDLDYSRTKAEHHKWATQAHASYSDLEPGTTYHASITVRDVWGNEDEASGYFTTPG